MIFIDGGFYFRIFILRTSYKIGVKKLAGKCPEWIFDITCSRACIQFLSDSHPLEMSGNHFCELIGRNFEPIDPKLVAEMAEYMARFLSEIDAGEDAVVILNQFIYYRLNYENMTKTRNLKPLFGNAEDGVSEAKHNLAVKRFKAYVFGLRSNNSPTPPPGWDVIKNTENLALLKDLVSTSINPLDLF